MIEVKNLVKKYGDNVVVDDVSFTIEKGKITSLIGPNGAGKSTILAIISRLMDKDSGQVIIEGTPVEQWDNKELSKKMAILKQSNNINVRLTVEDLVAFGRFPHCEGRLKAEDKKFIEEAINYMKLQDIKDKYLDELSGGQRQRAYIAMVIAQNTEYILLDEPLNNLDMKNSVEMMRVLKSLAKDMGKTIIIVIHDINCASCYSDNIVVLKNGKLVKNAPKEKVICKHILEDIYDMDFEVKDVEGNKICIYY